jgi:NADPH oxidase
MNSQVKLLIFWLLFGISHFGLFIYGYFKQKLDPELNVLNRLETSVYMSRGAGLVLALDCTLILIPMCRNIQRSLRALPFLGWIPWDDSVYLHKMTAYSILLFTFIHTNSHYTNFFNVQSRIPELGLKPWQIHYSSWGGTTGHLLLLIMFLMFTTTALSVRQKKFEIFW